MQRSTKNLRIDAERLWDNLMETAKIGATPKGGLCRLTLGEADRQIRDWFKAEATSLGCRLRTDDMGVMFAGRAGLNAAMPPIAMGSHLDSQPTGGRFDGVLGVLGAFEVLRTLRENSYETFAGIEVINWTNEEGARFSPAMMASGVFAGLLDRAWALARTDQDGIRFSDALSALVPSPDETSGRHPLSAFFELHIEQGPLLEMENFDIGVVTGVQGMRWYEIEILGQDAHTGATPMERRKNALLGASGVIASVERIARSYGPDARGTIGSLHVTPNSPNVVPGTVHMTADWRHPNTNVLDAMERDFTDAVRDHCTALSLGHSITKVMEKEAVRFDASCIACVRDAAKRSGFRYREMVSGAGHDAANIAVATPSAMIFVPCRDGVSHNESEFCSKEQCAAGTQVLLETVLSYDRFLAEQHR